MTGLLGRSLRLTVILAPRLLGNLLVSRIKGGAEFVTTGFFTSSTTRRGSSLSPASSSVAKRTGDPGKRYDK